MALPKIYISLPNIPARSTAADLSAYASHYKSLAIQTLINAGYSSTDIAAFSTAFALHTFGSSTWKTDLATWMDFSVSPSTVTPPFLPATVTLTDAATIVFDAGTGATFTVTLKGNRTLAYPTDLSSGAKFDIFIYQDNTGSRTLAYATGWKFPGGTKPVLSTAAGSLDLLKCCYDGTNLVAELNKAYA